MYYDQTHIYIYIYIHFLFDSAITLISLLRLLLSRARPNILFSFNASSNGHFLVFVFYVEGVDVILEKQLAYAQLLFVCSYIKGNPSYHAH